MRPRVNRHLGDCWHRHRVDTSDVAARCDDRHRTLGRRVGWRRILRSRRVGVPQGVRGGGRRSSARRSIIEFEGVYRDALITIQRRGRRPPPLRLLTDSSCLSAISVQAGENELVVSVRSGNDSRWYGGAGIHRNVSLLTGGSVYLAPHQLEVLTPDVDTDGAVVAITAIGAQHVDGRHSFGAHRRSRRRQAATSSRPTHHPSRRTPAMTSKCAVDCSCPTRTAGEPTPPTSIQLPCHARRR